MVNSGLPSGFFFLIFRFTDLDSCCVSGSGEDEKVEGVIVMMYECPVDALKQEGNTALHVLGAIVISINVGIATISSTCEQRIIRLTVNYTVVQKYEE